jgi:hypothetical protein
VYISGVLVAAARDRVGGAPYPATALVAGARLASLDGLVEVQALAVRDG